MKTYPIMVDIETTGTRFAKDSILQIGAVSLYEEKEIELCLCPRNANYEPEAIKATGIDINTFRYALSPQIAMNRFSSWVKDISKGYDKVVFWNDGSALDFSMIKIYFDEWDIQSPFHYCPISMDNIFYFHKEIYKNERAQLKKEINFTHDALEDAKFNKILYYRVMEKITTEIKECK